MVVSFVLLCVFIGVLVLGISVVIDACRRHVPLKKRGVILFFLSLGLAVAWQSFHLIDSYGPP